MAARRQWRSIRLWPLSRRRLRRVAVPARASTLLCGQLICCFAGCVNEVHRWVKADSPPRARGEVKAVFVPLARLRRCLCPVKERRPGRCMAIERVGSPSSRPSPAGRNVESFITSICKVLRGRDVIYVRVRKGAHNGVCTPDLDPKEEVRERNERGGAGQTPELLRAPTGVQMLSFSPAGLIMQPEMSEKAMLSTCIQAYPLSPTLNGNFLICALW